MNEVGVAVGVDVAVGVGVSVGVGVDVAVDVHVGVGVRVGVAVGRGVDDTSASARLATARTVAGPGVAKLVGSTDGAEGVVDGDTSP